MAEVRQQVDQPYDQAPKDGTHKRTTNHSNLTGTPVTPTARVPSAFSTPGSTFNSAPDAIVMELTPRSLCIGFEGEAGPQCCIRFRPEDGHRDTDMRPYLPGYVRPRESLETWGQGYELWQNDLQDFDLRFMSDRLERVVRHGFNTVLLTEIGVAKLVLVLPSLVPHPVLEAILQTMFGRWSFPSITLQPGTAMALIGAGLRSGLVIDIGWEETVVTALFDLREVKAMRTTRGMKSFTRQFGDTIVSKLSSRCRFDVEYIEEVLLRLGSEITTNQSDKTTSIEWVTAEFTERIDLPVATLRELTKEQFFNEGKDHRPDDHERPLHEVMYKCLLALPVDARSVCLSRLVFVGDGSQMTGLDSLVVEHVKQLVDEQNWSTVQPKAAVQRRQTTSILVQHGSRTVDARHSDRVFGDGLVEERYLKDKAKHSSRVVQGTTRQVSTLGSWAGASLLASLKVKSVVEVPRDQFLSHGLSSAVRGLDANAASQKRIGTSGPAAKSSERSSWTLSGWG